MSCRYGRLEDERYSTKAPFYSSSGRSMKQVGFSNQAGTALGPDRRA